jgi:hypothetical protein
MVAGYSGPSVALLLTIAGSGDNTCSHPKSQECSGMMFTVPTPTFRPHPAFR